jgi:hypothetical protein
VSGTLKLKTGSTKRNIKYISAEDGRDELILEPSEKALEIKIAKVWKTTVTFPCYPFCCQLS